MQHKRKYKSRNGSKRSKSGRKRVCYDDSHRYDGRMIVTWSERLKGITSATFMFVLPVIIALTLIDRFLLDINVFWIYAIPIGIFLYLVKEFFFRSQDVYPS